MSASRVPQRTLPDLRKALAAETATVEAIVPGESGAPAGTVSMIENTVDPATGMVMVRATMDNADELLWPGTLVNTQADLADRGRGDRAVGRGAGEPDRHVRLRGARTARPRCRPVKVERTVDNQSVITRACKAARPW